MKSIVRIAFKASEHIAKGAQRRTSNCRSLRDRPVAEVERGLQPWSGTCRMRSVRNRKVVTVSKDWYSGGNAVPECEQVEIASFHHTKSFVETRLIEAG